ncbi:hypothetical protein Dsin_015261 [Dipteronia sinensis]|uniref:Uncharacterized protein n=1 Tax=Dipteronia sinensis TaxID=43782 RepID=A0AAE0AB02_9ROSI|nr:hypothetical protein Dsin_015261 [Dipteronia sinensis]
MLHRSFKSAKCKTALKLAASRMKLMKNKRDVQVKQLKKELAKLLESGQVQTARIRVEHVVREQKIMAAYELLEIYCELIAARLPMIESQKNCPIDLKEAISSVIFASPRCDDIPELKDVRKHLTAKYGKEFASAAVELRPNCGVSRLMVEKLSATAPDGPTKVKILSAIAEEHNITWDPDSFSGGDLKPPEDLLNGPNTFGKASETLPDLPNVPPAPSSHGDKVSSSVQVSPNSNKRHDLPVNFHEQNARSPPRSQTDVGANEVKQSGAFHPELRPTGSSAARMEFRHPYSEQGQPFSSGSQSWNMEFTDATAAAQAAAESAERASMAARAAAELSSRGNSTRRYSTESHRNEESQRYADSTLRNEHQAKGPINNSFHGRTSRTHLEQIDGNQQHDVSGINENFQRESLKGTDKSSQSASLKSNAASVDGNPSENSTWQYSTESHRDEESQRYADSTLRNEHRAKGPVNNSFHGRNSRMHFEQIDGNQQLDDAGINDNFHRESLKSTDKPSRSASLKSNATSVDVNPVGNNLQMADGYSQKNSSELKHTDLLGQMSFKNQSSKSEVDFVNKLQGGVDSQRQNVDAYEGVRIRKQSSRASSHSQSSSFSGDDDVISNINCQSLGDDVDENPFSASDNKIVQRNSHSMNSHENATAVFDDSGSDDDVFKIGIEGGYKEHDYSLDFSSPSRKSPANALANANAWSDRQNFDESRGKSISQSHLFTEHQSDPIFSDSLTSSRVPSQSDDMFQATFDDYDVQSSESEEELDKTKFDRTTDTSKHNIYPTTSEMTEDVSPRFAAVKEDSELLKQSSLDSGKDLNFGLLTDDLDKTKLGRSTDTSKHNTYYRTSEMTQGDTPRVAEAKEDTELLKQSSLDSGAELNFGILRGGRRNKGNGRPPYIMSLTTNASSSKMAVEDTSTKFEEFPAASVKASISPGATSQEPYNRKVSAEADKTPRTTSYFASRGDDHLDDELTQHTSKTGLEENKKFRSRTQVQDFDSDDSDSEDNSRKQVSMSKADMSTPLSRRTRAPPSNSEKSSYSKTTVLSESSVNPGYGKERNSSSRTLYNTESRPERQYQNKSSGALGSSGQSRLAEEAAYKPNSPSKRSTFEESLKFPAKEQPSNSVPKNEKSDSNQSLKTSSGESPSRERSAKSRLAEQAAYKPNSPSKRSTFEESLKFPAKEQPSNSVPKNEKSDSNQSLKTSSVESPCRERSAKSRLAEQAAYKPNSPSKRSTFEESLKFSVKELPSNSFPKNEKSVSTQSLKSSSVESPSKERAAKSRWAEQAAYKPNAPSKRSSFEESLKSPAKEQPSNSVPRKEKSDSFQSLKSSTSMESPSRERAAHVHPKLPDYDDLAARLQSIRLNRQ